MRIGLEGQESIHSNNELSALSVSELNKQIKIHLESEFPLVWVQGELSNFTAHRSGHWYFSLKDAQSQISCVMFKGNNLRLKFKAEVGMEVLVRARISVYEPRGSYQLTVELMEPVGAGALQKQFEQLKRKLASEGLFDASRKKPLPSFPKKIALVTSPTGAAIRDIIHVVERRYPLVELILFPCTVQGDAAPKEISAALTKAIQFEGVDIVILGRGGGSAEDLWGFNDESLARIIAGSTVPVISAVGHEIDFTISDFVSDLRAPTPSAAAEIAVPSVEDLGARIQSLKNTLANNLLKRIHLKKQELKSLTRAMIDPQKDLERKQQSLDELQTRLERGIRALFKDRRANLVAQKNSLLSPKAYVDLLRAKLTSFHRQMRKSVEVNLKEKKANLPLIEDLSRLQRNLLVQKRRELVSLGKNLNSLSPLAVLDRGYSIALNGNIPIKSIHGLNIDQEFELKLVDGSIKAKKIGNWEKLDEQF